VTDSVDALHAALAAAGLSVEALPEDQRAMFSSLTEEDVTRLITLCAGRTALGSPESASQEATEPAGHGQPPGDC
jgi:hypothetical protein